MTRRIVGVLAAMTVGCGGLLTPCPQVDCANAVLLTVTDEAGAPVNNFSGIVSGPGERFTVGCGTEAAPDAGSASEDGGEAFVGEAYCEGNTVRLFNASGAHDVTVELRSGSRSFNGVVTLVSESTPAGPLECNTSCSTQKGSVVLQ